MLIREPELAFNTENKRIPRGGRQYSYCRASCCGCGCDGCDPNSKESILARAKRAAEKDEEEEEEIEEKSDQSKAYWVNLFNRFDEMTDEVSNDLALFLYCILN